MREVVDLAGAANPTALCEGGRRARKQPSKGHTLAELAPHVKLELENYLEDTSFVYYSPPSKLLDRIWQPCSGQGCGCGRSRTDAHRRACARVALGLSIRMHRIACAYARGTQPAPCTHLACAASARLTPKLLHTGRTPILWRVSSKGGATRGARAPFAHEHQGRVAQSLHQHCATNPRHCRTAEMRPSSLTHIP